MFKNPVVKTIDVTEQDIRHGIPCKAGNCPIALASERVLTKMTGFPIQPFVDGDYITATIECDNYGTERIFLGDLPLIACEFIQDYDSRLPVKPFSFECTFVVVDDAYDEVEDYFL